MKKKNPWIAAILNFLVPGTGYLYAGTRVRFGVLLIAAMVLWTFGPTPQYAQDVTVDPQSLLTDSGVIVMAIAGVMIAFGFAYDAYFDVKQHNEGLGKKLKEDS